MLNINKVKKNYEINIKPFKTRHKLNLINRILLIILVFTIITTTFFIHLYFKTNAPIGFEVKNHYYYNNDYELLKEIKPSEDFLGILHLKGVFKNTSGKQFTFCQLEYTLYDKNNNIIGIAFANTNNLNNQEIWNYDAVCLKKNGNLYKYELSNIIFK